MYMFILKAKYANTHNHRATRPQHPPGRPKSELAWGKTHGGLILKTTLIPCLFRPSRGTPLEAHRCLLHRNPP